MCSLFNFCPQSAQPRHHKGDLVGLAPLNTAPSPQIETWNTITQWNFCQLLEHQAPAQTQSPPVENFLATVLSLLLIHRLSTRSPILPKWKKSLNTVLTCAVAWPAQNFGWVKLFDFRWATIFDRDTAS